MASHYRRAGGVLLRFQRRWVTETAGVALCVKSRQIGISWATAAWAVREAARHGPGGHNVYYTTYRHDVGEQFIDDCVAWAEARRTVAVRADEVVEDPDGDYQVYRIKFASGYEIVALPGRPRTLRSRRGHIVIDEAAHLDKLPEVLEAALAMRIWGHCIRIISTQLGEGAFYAAQLEAPDRGWAVHQVTFADAIADGMYAVVATRQRKEWTQEGQDAWEAQVRRDYGDRAAQELDCIPADTGAEARVLPAKAVNDCIRRREDVEIDPHVRPQIGFDVSGDGHDDGVAVVRYGPVVTWIEVLQGDTIDQARRVHTLAMDLNASAVSVDAGGGYGTAAAAWLRGQEYVTYAIREVLFGDPPAGRQALYSGRTTNGQQFARRNAQMAWAVRHHLIGVNPDLVILADAARNLPMLRYVMQLAQPVWTRDTAMRIHVDKGEPSPDAYDATVLAFAEESRRGLRAAGVRRSGRRILTVRGSG